MNLETKREELTTKLLDNLDVLKRLFGSEWEAKSKPYRVIILGVMAATGSLNPLEVVIPMAQDMAKKGHNPIMLIATATDMSANAKGPTPDWKKE